MFGKHARVRMMPWCSPFRAAIVAGGVGLVGAAASQAIWPHMDALRKPRLTYEFARVPMSADGEANATWGNGDRIQNLNAIAAGDVMLGPGGGFRSIEFPARAANDPETKWGQLDAPLNNTVDTQTWRAPNGAGSARVVGYIGGSYYGGGGFYEVKAPTYDLVNTDLVATASAYTLEATFYNGAPAVYPPAAFPGIRRGAATGFSGFVPEGGYVALGIRSSIEVPGEARDDLPEIIMAVNGVRTTRRTPDASLPDVPDFIQCNGNAPLSLAEPRMEANAPTKFSVGNNNCFLEVKEGTRVINGQNVKGWYYRGYAISWSTRPNIRFPAWPGVYDVHVWATVTRIADPGAELDLDLNEIPDDVELPGMGMVGSQLYDNGAWITHTDGGANDARRSVLPAGAATYGFGAGATLAHLADDFTVPPGETWHISGATVYAYQTAMGYGAEPASPITDLQLAIYDGPPWNGGQIVAGDFTTNRLLQTEWSGAYRVTAADPLGDTRPVMEAKGGLEVELGAGTYWLAWSAAGTNGAGVFSPPTDPINEPVSGTNAVYYWIADNTWYSVYDSGLLAYLDVPFRIEGSRMPHTSACLKGDANCDGTVDFFDIDPFLLAIFDSVTYQASYCGGSTCEVDANCSGGVTDFFDIDPFLAIMFNGGGGQCPPG